MDLFGGMWPATGLENHAFAGAAVYTHSKGRWQAHHAHMPVVVLGRHRVKKRHIVNIVAGPGRIYCEIAYTETGQILKKMGALARLYAVAVACGFHDKTGRGYVGPCHWYAQCGIARSPPTGADERSREPGGELRKAIDRDFGSFEKFKEAFVEAGAGLFGSGWVWLSRDNDGKLVITQGSNAQNPLRDGLTPLLTFDVWEHAYYIDYKNLRADYLRNLWNIVDWDVVESRY